MKRLLLATAAVALAMPAFAADVPETRTTRTATAIFDWSGFYAGAHAGYAWGEARGSISPFGFGPFAYSPDPDGWFYGLQAGAQRQLGTLVLGVDGSISKANIKGSSGVTGPGGAIAGLSTSYDVAWLAMAEVKAGFAWGAWLPHLTAGGACGLGNATAAFGATSVGSSDTWHCGWTAGAGLDWAIASNLILNVGYRYVDLGSAQVSFPISGGVGVSVPVDLKAHMIRGGASLKF